MQLSMRDPTKEAPEHFFSLTWDNVQWESHAHRQGSEGRNKFYLQCLAFAAKNRTPSSHLDVSLQIITTYYYCSLQYVCCK